MPVDPRPVDPLPTAGAVSFEAPAGDGLDLVGHDPDGADPFVFGLPSPEVLQAYEQVSPGLADRILTLAETEAQARRDAERAAASAIPYDRIAQLAALVVVVLFLVASVYLITRGHPITGCILGIVDLVALISVFATAGRRGSRGGSPG